MVALDWGTLIDAILNGLSTVITAIITALTTNATLLAELAIGAVLVTGAVKFGNKTFKALGGMFRKLVPK